MQSDGDSGLGSLEAQLANKEREWKELLAARVHQMESFLKKAQDECSSLRQEELNQFHMHVTQHRARETEERQEVLSKSRHNAAQHRLQLDELKGSMAGEIQKQTEEYERMKWIHELEGELTLQRQEMTAAFNSELRQQEHEFNLKMDELRAVVISHDLKIKLLSKETEVYCQAEFQATEALKASKEFCQQIQTQLQHKEQEIKDLTAVKDNRIKELEDELKWMKTKLKRGEDDHIKKYEDVIEALKVCDVQLEAQYQAHIDQLQKAEKHIVKLQEKMEVLAAQAHWIRKDQQEAMEQKDETIQRLCREVETTRSGWDKYIIQVLSEMVVKDTEIITLQERESKCRTELERIREEMKGYKQHLSAGLKRERALEQMRVQVELEWQRHCEDTKAESYLANEQLIQDLTQARDQAKAELKEKEQELKEKEQELKEKEQELQDLIVLLRSINTDQAIQGLTQKVDCVASEEICHLQEQNNILRAMVTQMRKDMERLSHLLFHLQAHPQASNSQPVHQGAPAQMATGPLTKSTDISSKISPPGGLCLEKHANTSALMKQDVRVAHIMKQGAKSNPPLLQSRLKQAAFCIVRLSREKQQLIEMGNRLRRQITTAGLKEKIGDQHDRLSTLEQQYQLTTQSSNKKKQTPPLSQSQMDVGPQHHSGLFRSRLSSEESLWSLNELWEILDHGLSPSIFSEGEGELSRKEVAESGAAGVQMIVHGISAPIHSQPPTKVQQRKNPWTAPLDTTETSRPGVPNRISKIRNYNVKD